MFRRTMTFAVAIIGDPTSNENEDLEEWISMAQNLLRDIGPSSRLAMKAVEHLDAVRRRTRSVMHRGYDPSSGPAPIIPIDHYLPKATQTMAQPQPSMSDVFDVQSTEPIWQEVASSYPGRFPGIEVVSSEDDFASFERFLDYCAPQTQF
ncbi:hypothetical protein DXG03_003515 [Asterophora parasitica]|uniref:Uncharacterized protein n=1 Tax=Asterophora parasitica TaxID=117018 RepID=A0A9P7GFP1_9AGAR|nr:hypothetical protein DXG03_003515 [Asterophora parasitica]